MQTHRANTARHSADSYCFHLPQRWLSNELENTEQLHEKVWGYKQLPTVSIRSEMLPTFFRCRTIQTRYLKDRDSMPNPINKFDPLKGQNDKKNKTYRRQEICCVATGQLSWGSLGTESQTSSHRPPTSSYDTLQKHRPESHATFEQISHLFLYSSIKTSCKSFTFRSKEIKMWDRFTSCGVCSQIQTKVAAEVLQVKEEAARLLLAHTKRWESEY